MKPRINSICHHKNWDKECIGSRNHHLGGIVDSSVIFLGEIPNKPGWCVYSWNGHIKITETENLKEIENKDRENLYGFET